MLAEVAGQRMSEAAHGLCTACSPLCPPGSSGRPVTLQSPPPAAGAGSVAGGGRLPGAADLAERLQAFADLLGSACLGDGMGGHGGKGRENGKGKIVEVLHLWHSGLGAKRGIIGALSPQLTTNGALPQTGETAVTGCEFDSLDNLIRGVRGLERRRVRLSGVAGSLEKLAPDEHAADFAGTAPDLVNLGVPQQPSRGYSLMYPFPPSA